MRSILTQNVDADDSDSIEKLQCELSIIALQFGARSIENSELLVGSGYLSFLLGLLPFVSQKADIPIIELVRHCMEVGVLVIQFFDIPQFLAILRCPDADVYRSTCALLRTIINRDSGYALVVLKCGLADVLLELMDDTRSFREKVAVLEVLSAVMVNDVDDSELTALLSAPIIEMCREVHEVDRMAVQDLFAVLTRFHAITFDVPELHRIVEDLIEELFEPGR
jgi:hypothetical protein